MIQSINLLKIIKKCKTSEFGMRLTEKFYPTKKNDPVHTERFSQAMNRYKKCTSKKDRSQINRDIHVCRNYWKCYPHHYFMYDLYRMDMQLTDDQLKDYIPQFYWSYLFLPYYTSQKFSMIADDKIITEHFFNSLHISQPKTECVIVNGKLYSPGLVRLSYHQMYSLLQSNPSPKLFVKPAQGAGGKGFYIFHKNDEDQYITGQGTIFNEKFLTLIGSNQNYLIQTGISQDSEISQIYPNSVNTFRIITENKDGLCRLVSAVLRIGRGQNEVDNASAGGIFIKIDSDRGKMGDFAVSHVPEKFFRHPDTNFVFHNSVISRWDEIRRFTIDSAAKLPFFTYLGWDIALTSAGPVAIEINRTPSIELNEMPSGGLREAFRIEDPAYYWKNPGKRI